MTIEQAINADISFMVENCGDEGFWISADENDPKTQFEGPFDTLEEAEARLWEIVRLPNWDYDQDIKDAGI